MERLGWVGTALVIVAYVPQIRHLYIEKCAWGISISTWLIWLVAGALLLSYCVFRNDTLFTFVQVINITANYGDHRSGASKQSDLPLPLKEDSGSAR